MQIELQQVGKRFRFEWIFRKLDYSFVAGQHYAVLGHNGSGKSTLLRILAGQLSPSHGKIQYLDKQGQSVSRDRIYRQVSMAAPYMELIEEFTLAETIRFQQRFKPFQSGLQEKEMVDLLQLPNVKGKEIRNYSSGMKQRLRVGLALMADTPIVLLDEPTSNLDQAGVDWYHQRIREFGKDRLVIVASNVEADVDFCQHRLNVVDYKKARTHKT
jgi:ABC-type multidrug transport system ATPase subunit